MDDDSATVIGTRIFTDFLKIRENLLLSAGIRGSSIADQRQIDEIGGRRHLHRAHVAAVAHRSRNPALVSGDGRAVHVRATAGIHRRAVEANAIGRGRSAVVARGRELRIHAGEIVGHVTGQQTVGRCCHQVVAMRNQFPIAVAGGGGDIIGGNNGVAYVHLFVGRIVEAAAQAVIAVTPGSCPALAGCVVGNGDVFEGQRASVGDAAAVASIPAPGGVTTLAGPIAADRALGDDERADVDDPAAAAAITAVGMRPAAQ